MAFFGGAKESGMAAVGAAVGVYAGNIAQKNIGLLNQYWWATPAALFLAGHAVRKKNVALGYGLVGTAGALIGQHFAQGGTLGGGAAATAKGYDAGILLDPSDVRMLSASTAQGYGYDAGIVLTPQDVTQAMGL